MGIPNRDTITAIVLLLLCGVLFWVSFDIRSPDYGILLPSAWVPGSRAACPRAGPKPDPGACLRMPVG